MTTETPEVVAPVATPEATEASESIKAGYDRIANPESEPTPPVITTPEPQTAETPPEPPMSLTGEQIKDLMGKVARIPELEKRLRDEGGRYGALKQSLEQLQQRIETPGGATGVDVEDALAEIKEAYGEDELYRSLKSAFSKVAARRELDPAEIGKLVADKIAEVKQAETAEAIAQLDEAHPTWREDRQSPEFAQWRESLSAKDRARLDRSKDPDFVADRLDAFQEWKAAKAAKPPEPPAKPDRVPSRRLVNAVLPTNGAKPKTPGADNDSAASIRAGYERVAGARMR